MNHIYFCIKDCYIIHVFLYISMSFSLHAFNEGASYLRVENRNFR